MNRGSSSLPPRPPAGRRPSQPGFTPQQKLILVLAGLLVTAWIAVAIVFLSSGGASASRSTASQSPAENFNPLPSGSPVEPSRTGVGNPPAASIAISAACAQNNNSVQEGEVTHVGDNGLLEITTSSGVMQVGLAGIQLLPGGKGLEIIREMAANQPVALVRDLSTQEEDGQPQRYVFTRQQFVNYELVRQGVAVVNPDSPKISCAATFQLAEQKARSERLGMWEPTRVPTLTFVPMVTLDTSSQPACTCSRRYECSDFNTHAEAQACYNACNDYNSRLDLDRDGIACEELP